MATTQPPKLPAPVRALGEYLRRVEGHVATTRERHERGMGPDLPSLEELARARDALDEAITGLVVLLRNGLEERDERGRRVVIVEPQRWADIADDLGMTRQGATKRYGPAVETAAGRPVTRVERRRRR